MNEYHNQMADRLDVDPATFQPTVHTYLTQIKLNGKTVSVTTFDLEVDAAYARDQAMEARLARNNQGIVRSDKSRNFSTEQDWLDARQVEIDERRLKTVPKKHFQPELTERTKQAATRRKINQERDPRKLCCLNIIVTQSKRTHIFVY